MIDSHTPSNEQSVSKLFLRYFIPSMSGMLLMAANLIIDGVMVGSRLGASALAGIGIASPVYTIFVAGSLWIGTGAATRYSMEMGANNKKKARVIFTQSLVLIFIFTLVTALAAFSFRESLAYLLGANTDTYPYVSAYLTILLLFGFVFSIESVLSLFVHYDNNPNLAMAALGVSSAANIGFNYLFLYVYDFGTAGVAVSTVLASILAVFILAAHFFSTKSNLKLIPFAFNKQVVWSMVAIGFPSFLAEIGSSVFTISHNLTLGQLAGTNGLTAFSILTYVHSVMLLVFLGIGSAMQPLISFYHGAAQEEKKKETVRIAIGISIGAGTLFFLAGQLAAVPIISLFGDFPTEVMSLASDAIGLFFFAYLFMGINFVMMTYYQSVGHVRMAVWITSAREMLLMLLLLAVLPFLFGVPGVWLAIPFSELLVFITILQYKRRIRFKQLNQAREQLEF